VTLDRDPARPGSITSVLAAMTARLDRLPAESGSRREFLRTYRRTTAAVGAAVDAGVFEDARWVEAWDVVFADLYLAALDADLDGTSGVPRPWRQAFDAPASLHPLQHVLLGINAHVNHDLAIAVVDVAHQLGDLESIRKDFDRVNDVLGLVYVDVLKDLDRVSRWANLAASVGGGRAFNFSLQVARRRSWQAAEILHPLRGADRTGYLHELDRLVSVLAYLITKPGFPMSVVVGLARRLEEHDPKRVVTALLGTS
jgi:Family of unknown function (DUF5995)